MRDSGTLVARRRTWAEAFHTGFASMSFVVDGSGIAKASIAIPSSAGGSQISTQVMGMVVKCCGRVWREQ